MSYRLYRRGLAHGESSEVRGARSAARLADSEPWFDEAAPPRRRRAERRRRAARRHRLRPVRLLRLDIDTPHIDALAAGGLQFTNFHVTPLCSPTRASLLTGRSQHAVGMRALSNFRTGFPNQLGHISDHAATVAEVLRDEGYATFCAGKWHLAPMEQCSAAGPFDQWPLGARLRPLLRLPRGRDRPVPPRPRLRQPPDRPAGRSRGRLPPHRGPRRPAAADDRPTARACGPTARSSPTSPFGATHAPHQAPPEYLAKYRGAFDEGWDVVRAALVRAPARARRDPRGHRARAAQPRRRAVGRRCPRTSSASPAGCRRRSPRSSTTPTTRSAGSSTACAALGELDNTIARACSPTTARRQEGGPFGVMHEMKFFNGILETPDEAIERIDDIGGPHSHTNYPWGWAQCGNTPFKWYKQNTHEGGVHVPMIVHWPAGIAADQRGTKRDQFVNVADIVPDDLRPARRHAARRPTAASSSCRSPATRSPACSPTPRRRRRNTLQYFEMAGSRALVAGELEGGVQARPGRRLRHRAVGAVPPRRRPRPSATTSPPTSPTGSPSSSSCGGPRPSATACCPSTTACIELFGARFRDRLAAPADRRYVYRPPMSPMPGPGRRRRSAGAASTSPPASTRDARATRACSSPTGTENSGISRVRAGRPAGRRLQRVRRPHRSSSPTSTCPAGDAELAARVPARGRPVRARSSCSVDGVDAGRADLPLFMRMISSVGASVGYDHGSAVSTRYDRTVPLHRHAARGRHPARHRAVATPSRGDGRAAAEMARQ